ncbi:hemolysin D [Rhodopirellula sp. ICT_H3.1]|uniref:Hemolysin D n=2 Tax=Aporhodopirellula aestuarii TaxID=2950107 RepID=A0ABT0U6C3_9BACT|nr:hemolysin D [Aporhodopirellula aestuarii]
MCPSHSPGTAATAIGPMTLRRSRAIACLLAGIVASAISVRSTHADEPIQIDQAQVLLIQNTSLSTPIAGRVDSVEIVEGEQIVPGRVLARLDERRARGEWSAAQAALHAAMIQAENDVNTRYAKRSLEVRERELQQSDEANKRYPGSVTATEIDRLQLVIDQAELAVEQSEQEREIAQATAAEKQAACELAKQRLDEHTIESTINGQVAEVFVQNGQWVEAGAPIVRLISLDPIRVSGFVDGRLHDSGLVGRKVRFEIAPPQPSSDVTSFAANSNGDSKVAVENNVDEATVLYGVVTFVSAELHPVTSQVRLWATVDNPNRKARPGMRGKLTID